MGQVTIIRHRSNKHGTRFDVVATTTGYDGFTVKYQRCQKTLCDAVYLLEEHTFSDEASACSAFDNDHL
jgi:hypothetical protein